VGEVESLVAELFREGTLVDAVLSKPRAGTETRRVAVRPLLLRGSLRYQLTSHFGDRTVNENLEPAEAERRLCELVGGAFRQSLLRTADADYQVLGTRVLRRPPSAKATTLEHDRAKRRLLEEAVPNPFLVELGVMTPAGKVRASRYGKFRQLNRFLELVDDVVPHLPDGPPLRIVDFGSGRAYLTFALYQHLHEGRGLELDVLGLDLKADVVERCNALAKTLGYEALRFEVGDIAGYEGVDAVDLVISLHACDTATDAALERAVRWNAEVILAVPCCQHELAGQLEADGGTPAALLEHGIVRERFAALATDALRAKLLEAVGYRTQIVEFVDLEHTAKNVLIRAVRRRTGGDPAGALQEYRELRDSLGVSPYLERALEDRLVRADGAHVQRHP
jgi:SAM-dependent methyltransferase